MFRKLLIVMVLVLSSISGITSASASADNNFSNGAEIIRYQTAFADYFACAGETINWEGDAQITVQVVDPEHSIMNVLYRLRGVGQTSLRSYILNGQVHVHTITNHAETYMVSYWDTVAGYGRTQTRFHMTVDANGDITALFLEVGINCQ